MRVYTWNFGKQSSNAMKCKLFRFLKFSNKKTWIQNKNPL